MAGGKYTRGPAHKMGRKRTRGKAPTETTATAQVEEEKDEQDSPDASTITPSAKRKARSGKRTSTMGNADEELEPLSTEEGDDACRVGIGVSIGGASDTLVDKVASRLPGRRAQVAALARLLDEVSSWLLACLSGVGRLLLMVNGFLVHSLIVFPFDDASLHSLPHPFTDVPSLSSLYSSALSPLHSRAAPPTLPSLCTGTVGQARV